MGKVGVDPRNHQDTLLFENTNFDGYSTRMVQRPLFSIGHRPDYYTGNPNYIYMSLTMYSYLAETDFDEISYKYLLLRLKDPTDRALTD